MTISGGRTKQLDIFCRVTGFTSDFLSFIVVELLQFNSCNRSPSRYKRSLSRCVCVCVSVPHLMASG